VSLRRNGRWERVGNLEYRRLEEALRQSESLFRAAFEATGIGMAATDLAGRFILASVTTLVP
jgi:PAS domain-containing protein